MGQSPRLTRLQSSFIIWTLLRSSFTVVIQNWRFSAAWSFCIASVVPWTATFSYPEYNIDSPFSTLDYRILLVQAFGNGSSTKTIAGKLFGTRRVKWWLSVLYLSDARSLRNCATECAKNPSGTWENTIFDIHLNAWAMWFSDLFIVFSFRFIQKYKLPTLITNSTCKVLLIELCNVF